MPAFFLLFFLAGAALAQAPSWESRFVAGLHQAGASSARAHQNLFLDFYIVRPLSNEVAPGRARWSLWGNVRLASSPRQLSVPATQFTAGLLTTAARTPLNELAQSAEFLTGLELRLGTFRQGGRTRVVGLPVFYGAQGSLDDPAGLGRVYRAPAPGSPQRPAFEARYPQARSELIGLVPPDRERFDRGYGGGLRLTSYETGVAAPATYLVTVGQDQSLGGGRYRGLTARFDVFYPLAAGAGWPCFFLFGTAHLRLARPGTGATPLVLEPAAGVALADPRVSIQTWPAARDTYRLGAGIDVMRLLGALRR
jgi:hypothetical protein